MSCVVRSDVCSFSEIAAPSPQCWVSAVADVLASHWQKWPLRAERIVDQPRYTRGTRCAQADDSAVQVCL